MSREFHIDYATVWATPPPLFHPRRVPIAFEPYVPVGSQLIVVDIKRHHPPSGHHPIPIEYRSSERHRKASDAGRSGQFNSMFTT